MRRTLQQYLTRRSVLGLAGAAAATGLLAACGSTGDDDDDASDGQTGAAEKAGSTAGSGQSPTDSPEAGGDEIGPDGHFGLIQTANNGTKHLIPLDDIRSGGPPKDGIPSIDQPQFAGSDAWETLAYDDELLVLGLEVNGKRRAYPFQIMVWHELVNDTVEGVPILASYCPLCGSAIAFVREIETDEGVIPVEFGVSGKLYNSDLLMYDRKTDSYWSQLTGTAVVGEQAGARLDVYPSELMTWADWKAAYPDSEVLTRTTGHNRDYDNLPYQGYDESASIWFPVTATDDRLHEKTRVTGVELSFTDFGAYADEMVVEHGPVNNTFGGVPLLAVADPTAGDNVLVFRRTVGDQVLTFAADDAGLTDNETDSVWSYDGIAESGELEGSQLEPVSTIKGFWFAWFAFHQQTELWLPDDDEG